MIFYLSYAHAQSNPETLLTQSLLGRVDMIIHNEMIFLYRGCSKRIAERNNQGVTEGLEIENFF